MLALSLYPLCFPSFSHSRALLPSTLLRSFFLLLLALSHGLSFTSRLWLCFSSAAALPLLCLRAAFTPSFLCLCSASALPSLCLLLCLLLFVLLSFYALLVINILFDVLRKVRQIFTATKLLYFYRICNCRKREKEREKQAGSSCHSLLPVCVHSTCCCHKTICFSALIALSVCGIRSTMRPTYTGALSVDYTHTCRSLKELWLN